MLTEEERRRNGGAATCGIRAAGEREAVRVSNGTSKVEGLSFAIAMVQEWWLQSLMPPWHIDIANR